MTIPVDDLVRALYNVPAFRGSRTGGHRGGWWSSTPKEANHYAHFPLNSSEGMERVVIPGQLNTTGFPTVDAEGNPYDMIPSVKLPPGIASAIRRKRGILPEYVSTDDIALAVQNLKLPGATVLNVEDQASFPAHQYFVNDLRRRRSRFARFQDPNSEDIMAALLLSLMGAGAASTQGPDQNA